MSNTLGSLIERNLLEVFGQRDSARGTAAIAELYTEECTFFEAEEQVNAREALNAKVGSILEGCSRFRVSRRGACAGQSRSWPFAVAVRTCRSPPLVTGTDIAVFEHERIRALYTFLDESAIA
jgi:hypothetical protein